jgi:nucleotide-binding universal stress UspA family protein
MPLSATMGRRADSSATGLVAVTPHRSPSGDPDDQRFAGRKLDRILVATDSSRTSEHAIKFAVELASEHHSEVRFVHVMPIAEPGVSVADGSTEHDPVVLARAGALAREHGVIARNDVLVGSVVAEVVRYAEAHDVNLIVVGSGADGAVDGAPLGRVALGVLRAAERPLLIVEDENSVTYCGNGPCRDVRIYKQTGTDDASSPVRSPVPRGGAHRSEAITSTVVRPHTSVPSRLPDAVGHPANTGPEPNHAVSGRPSARGRSERVAGIFPALLGLLSGALRLETVVFVGNDSWAITATIPYEGVIMVAEFTTRASASEWFAIADTFVPS